VAGYGGLDARPAGRACSTTSLTLRAGQAIGVIGESGSARPRWRVVAGARWRRRARSRDHLRRIQIVFQMADTLNPAHTVRAILARPLELYHGLKGAALEQRIGKLLDLVQLPAAAAARLPGGLSGGQKQRVNLARALAAEPDLILADEVTSALDTVVGAAILDLMAELRRELGVSYLFISHDLNTVRAVCDEIVVMYAGRKVQAAPRAGFEQPAKHPYFELLADSVPELRRGWLDEVGARRAGVATVLPLAAAHDECCAFVSRCPRRLPGTCERIAPPLRRLPAGGEMLCHLNPEDIVMTTPELQRKDLIGTRNFIGGRCAPRRRTVLAVTDSADEPNRLRARQRRADGVPRPTRRRVRSRPGRRARRASAQILERWYQAIVAQREDPGA
jgi:peptide/nickel transport system ATP-binding protein